MTDVIDHEDEAPPDPPDPTTAAPNRSRQRLIVLILGAVCLAAALLEVRGPADPTVADVSWPAPEHEMLGPAPFGTPFLLTEREPANLAMAIPCIQLDQPGAREGEAERIVLATARSPREVYGLVVAVTDDRLVVDVGARRLLDVERAAPTSRQCVLQVQFGNGRWLAAYDGRQIAGGDEPMPAMSGLFTDYPESVAGELVPRVSFQTATQNSSPSTAQWAWLALAVVAGLGAIALSFGADRAVRRERVRRDWRAWRWYDAGVVVAVVWWWFVASPLSDDGWVMTTVVNHQSSGTFSNYFDAFNAPLVLGFLHDSLLQLIGNVSTSLLAFRIPAVVAAIGGWWMLTQILDRLPEREDGTQAFHRLAAAGLYLVCFFSSGMTLRPEPLVMVLTILVAREVQRFVARPTVSGLAVPLVAVAVAVSIHTTGVVAAAPLVLAIPGIISLVRRDDGELLAGLGVGLVSAAAMAMLIVADSDLAIWRRAQDLTTLTQAHNGGITNEYVRYQLLFGDSWGHPLLRFSVVTTALLCIGRLAVWLVGRLRARPTPVPGFAVAWLFGVALLALVPSKWPVHFSTLAGLAGLVAAVEVGTWSASSIGSVRVRARTMAMGVVVLGALVVVSAFVRPGRSAWVLFGLLHRATLNDGFQWVLAIAAALAVVLATASLWLPRSTRTRSSGSALIALVGLVLVGAVIGSLVLATGDAVAASPSWSVARQNLGAAPGGCGVAGSVTVGDPWAATPLEPAAATDGDDVAGAHEATDADSAADDAVEPPPTGSRWWQVDADGPRSFESPWYEIPDNGGTFVVWVAGGGAEEDAGAVAPELGRADGAEVTDITRGPDIAVYRPPWMRRDRWMPVYVATTGVRRADRIRIVGMLEPGREIMFSEVAVVPFAPLPDLLRSSTQAVHVDLRTVLPCADAASARGGLMEFPDYTVQYAGDLTLGMVLFGRSSFFMMSDAIEFPFVPLPLTTTNDATIPFGDLMEVRRTRPERLAPFERDGALNNDGAATGG